MIKLSLLCLNGLLLFCSASGGFPISCCPLFINIFSLSHWWRVKKMCHLNVLLSQQPALLNFSCYWWIRRLEPLRPDWIPLPTPDIQMSSSCINGSSPCQDPIIIIVKGYIQRIPPFLLLFALLNSQKFFFEK